MAYAFQSFTAGNVFTAAQANQIEANIRDHVHGFGGVGASGLSFTPASLGVGSITLAAADAAKFYSVHGTHLIVFPALATLGSAWGAAFANVGSQRVELRAAAGQLIGPSSFWALTPGEAVNIIATSAQLQILGKTTGDFLLADVSGNSLQQVDLVNLFDRDFQRHRIGVDAVNSNGLSFALGVIMSHDYGANFRQGQIYPVTINLIQAGVLASYAIITNSGAAVHAHTSALLEASNVPTSSGAVRFSMQGVSTMAGSGTTFTLLSQHVGAMSPATGSDTNINAFRFLCVGGGTLRFLPETRFRLWGLR